MIRYENAPSECFLGDLLLITDPPIMADAPDLDAYFNIGKKLIFKIFKKM